MQSKYIVHDFEHCLGHVVEECGETLAAAGKTLRWGWWSANPELPRDQQETNLTWLKREMGDLKRAIGRLEELIDRNQLPAPKP